MNIEETIEQLKKLKKHCEKIDADVKETKISSLLDNFWEYNVQALDKAISNTQKMMEIKEVISNMETTDDETVESFAFREIKQIIKEVE